MNDDAQTAAQPIANAATIRLVRDEDLAGVMAIERASFPNDAWSERSMRSTFKDRDAVTTVVERDARIIGYCSVLAPRNSDADILTIAVDSAARGEGFGRALLEGAVDAAAARGCRVVFLEVRVDNPVAQALYTSIGFAEVGRRKRYYQPDDVDALVMRLTVPRLVDGAGHGQGDGA